MRKNKRNCIMALVDLHQRAFDRHDGACLDAHHCVRLYGNLRRLDRDLRGLDLDAACANLQLDGGACLDHAGRADIDLLLCADIEGLVAANRAGFIVLDPGAQVVVDGNGLLAVVGVAMR